MTILSPNSRVCELLTLLAYVEEFPMRSLHLLGSKDAWRKLILKLSSPQEYRFSDTGERTNCRLLTLSGKGNMRTIRLYKSALPILERLNPNAYQYYTKTYLRFNHCGDEARIERSHRVAESVAMVRAAGIETRPFLLPPLQTSAIRMVVPQSPSFYISKELKRVGNDDINKTLFSRITGALFYPGGCYAVYNSRDYLMKWNGKGEEKTRLYLEETARMNAQVNNIPAAILFGTDFSIAYQTLEALEKIKRVEKRFDSIFEQMHFIPMTPFGIRLLKILTLPDWKETMMDLLFEPEDRSYGRDNYDCDAIENGVYMFSFLDCDIIRLNRFHLGLISEPRPFELLCFPEQTKFLRKLFGENVLIRTIEMDQLEDAMLPGRDDDET